MRRKGRFDRPRLARTSWLSHSLGYVYVYPRSESLRWAGADEQALARVGDHEAVAWFEVRPDAVAADLDRRRLAALMPWLRGDFAFTRVVLGTWEADARRVAVLRQAGLRPVWSHPERGTVALHVE